MLRSWWMILKMDLGLGGVNLQLTPYLEYLSQSTAPTMVIPLPHDFLLLMSLLSLFLSLGEV